MGFDEVCGRFVWFGMVLGILSVCGRLERLGRFEGALRGC